MLFKWYVQLIRSDLHRVAGKSTSKAFLKNLLLGEGFKYVFWMRTCAYFRGKKKFALPFIISRFFLKHYMYKFGISIPYTTKIGSGFYIGHFGGIVVNGHCEVGKNCNISHSVTLGKANRGSRKGYPRLGDNVYIGPGAKLIGNIKIGNNVAIGANCVVTKDIPDNAVVVGIPGKVISYDGSAAYINKVDYRELNCNN